MDKQSTLAFVLMGLVLVVWLYLNSPEPQPQNISKTDSTLVKEENKPEATKAIEKPLEEVVDPNSNNLSQNGLFSTTDKKAEIITIENDLVKLEMTSKGGKIRKYYLKDYETWYYDEYEESDFYNTHVQLLNQTNGGDLDLVFFTEKGKVNTSNLDFVSSLGSNYFKLSGSDSLKISYTYKIEGEKVIRKNFTFYGNNYRSKFNVELINMSSIIGDRRYDVVWASGMNFLELNSVDAATYANASFYSGGEHLIVDADTEGEPVERDVNGKIDWVSVKSKYFAMILAPSNPNSDGGAKIDGSFVNIAGLGVREYYSVGLKMPFQKTDYQKDDFTLYLGPVQYDTLKTYNANYDAIYDFGSFFGLKFITRPISEYLLQPLFTFLHSIFPNYGIVIILFSILIKLALSPLTKQSYKSMGRMSQLQPMIAELKEKYKGDQQKIQKETMKLYSTYGINPAGGCLPMVLQMPILFALFAFFRVAIEIRHESFLWIKDLASPDYVFALPFTIPLVNVDQITILAPLLGITMFFQQKMTVKDPSQKAMVYMMPVMMTFMFMGFSSGLNLYYMMFNLLSIIQQYYINKQQSHTKLVPVEKKNQKQGFMQKMMAAAEEKQKTQKQITKRR
ncbi:MAG: preprotein translocase YidC [Ignavibacteriales bacterium CG18_big_fil_WC_8_21_14_2_50_31_20]|nr:MAG: preprotein translocase YidC [Ignavibacteriales bacterium CG18_big_fil_WC_8_21_14_2_50_31_20]